METGIVGLPAPDLEHVRWIDEDGEPRDPLTLDELGPGFKVLYFFQDWCSGCHRHGFPTLVTLVNELRDKRVGFAAIQTVFEGSDINTFDRVRENQRRYGLRIPFGHAAADTGAIGAVPAIMDIPRWRNPLVRRDRPRWPRGVRRAREVRVFDSTAILIYLAEKTGKFLSAPEDRPELLSWLLFIASGLGPFSGQAVHFQFAAREGLDYAVNRYRREAERHYQVLNDHLEGRRFIVGDTYTIADISAWGWLDRASRVRKGAEDPLAAFPNLKRLFETVDARPAVARARAVGKDHTFKTANDEETKRALFPSNFPPAA